MTTRIITVAQQKGGTGKTTIAAHLAVYYMQKGFKTALLDVDPQGSLTHWYDERKNNVGESDDLFFSAVSGWRVHNQISDLKHKTDVIVIDSSPHAENDTRTVMREASLVLTPAQPSPTDLWATKTTIELIERERRPYAVVLNRVAANSRVAEKLSSMFPEGKTLGRVIGNRVAFPSAMLEGLTVLEGKSCPAQQEMRALCDEVDALVGNKSLATAEA